MHPLQARETHIPSSTKAADIGPDGQKQTAQPQDLLLFFRPLKAHAHVHTLKLAPALSPQCCGAPSFVTLSMDCRVTAQVTGKEQAGI